MQENNQNFGWIFLLIVFVIAALMLLRNSMRGRLIERSYRQALLKLRRERHSPEARMEALRAGRAFYGLRHNDGKPTLFDQELIAKEIQEATGEVIGQEKPTKPADKPITRPAPEYRNIRSR